MLSMQIDRGRPEILLICRDDVESLETRNASVSAHVAAEKLESQKDGGSAGMTPVVFEFQLTQEVQPPMLVTSGARMEATASGTFWD